MPKIVSAAEAVKAIPDGAVVAVNSSSGLNCPDAVLKALGERFDRDSHPRNLTMMHPIAAGDMFGISGVEHIAKPGLIGRIIGGSYPSGPSTSEPPMIWQMLGANEMPAYNVPSGIMFDMMREAAAKRPGVITKVGLDTFVDPDREGCAMNAKAAAQPIVRKIEFDGEEWLYFPAIVPNVAIIRASACDERGNLSFEQEGAYLGAMELALAAHNNGGIVIAQVRSIVENETLKPHQVRVPGILVDYIVEAPDQWQTTQTPYDPDDLGRGVQAALELRAHGVRHRQGHRAARGAGAEAGLGRQSRLRRLRQRAAHLHRGRPARPGHLGDRAGRGRRRAAARIPVRLRVECRGLRALGLPVHLLPGGGLRLLAAVLPADRPPRLRQRLEARRQAACDGGCRRLRRHHRAGARRSSTPASSMPAPRWRSSTAS